MNDRNWVLASPLAFVFFFLETTTTTSATSYHRTNIRAHSISDRTCQPKDVTMVEVSCRACDHIGISNEDINFRLTSLVLVEKLWEQLEDETAVCGLKFIVKTFQSSSDTMDDNQALATATILQYYHDMSKLHSDAALRSSFLGDDGRHALILDSTIFHPQGGGQPSDTGFITDFSSSGFKFIVQDVRSKNGIVYHYGVFEKTPEDLEGGVQVLLSVDASRRKLNSRLHSAGHLLDVCMGQVGLRHLEPGKGYHFPDGPYVEYKGVVPQAELQSKQNELELEANSLISGGGKVSVGLHPYEEAALLCGGALPDYIPKGSTPRIVKLGDFPGCPCGGTHVSNISELGKMKVTQMRTKKGVTKVYYHIED